MEPNLFLNYVLPIYKAAFPTSPQASAITAARDAYNLERYNKSIQEQAKDYLD